MNTKVLTTIALAVSLTACGSLGGFNSNPDQQIRNQKLQTSFNDGLKIESNCSWFKGDESCEFVSFEATVTVPALGGTGANAHTAKIRAELEAKAKIVNYLNEKVDNNVIASTVAKNIEKAKDSIKTQSGDNEDVVTMTENEAKVTPGKNVSFRENSNDTAYGVSQTIRQFASSNLQGCTTKYSADRQDVTAVVFCSKKNRTVAKKAYTLYNGQ